MEYLHPYSRYGLALVLEENGLNSPEEVSHEHLRNELIRGLGHFRLKPAETYEGAENVIFHYMTYEFIQSNSVFQNKGNTDEGIFLCPNIITSDKGAGQLWSGTNSILEKLNGQDETNENLTMSVFAASAKFNNGKKSQSTPKALLSEVACAAITNTTPFKPCLAYRVLKGGKTERSNTAIIPDLSLGKMVLFISLFKSMQSDVRKDLMIGRVFPETKGKGEKAKTIFKPWRPKIFNGNFPNPPQSSALGSVALLGAIGEWSKKANRWADGKAVLESLKNVPIYLVSYGSAKVYNFNHYIIDLAKEDKLNTIIDSVYYTKLFNTDNRSQNKNEYQVYDLLASRFLQLFNRPAFLDFLAFRGEYPNQIENLFITYFTKMEKIPIEIVQSAKILGSWLNYAAYLAAKNDKDNKTADDFKKAKSKFLVELESSAFSARRGDALVFQVIRRAALLSSSDAPSEADLYIEKTCSGELSLDVAKNLVIAFSRLKSKYQKSPEVEEEKDDNSEEDSSIDTSEYNED
ncbi:type I-PGING CRISPR-associated protein Cas8c/Csp2 [Marinilongibacter aquaticus]|uniref:type I-PGING CRISPR-associated protein Cas8c/Csp2 n=1 Tax=Marinilongibacter aquaticus TaxID=2975157 RepID=UPI0021BDCE38|nr:type I-PGING CRISPR-associated protein Cas8c/Csp2 [Marinilongibacter aquaticus]UBM57208.1 type I-PGING CRISPR-associated protein Cas8c/Csp2 [Marinilongibacter aquaticus]